MTRPFVTLLWLACLGGAACGSARDASPPLAPPAATPANAAVSAAPPPVPLSDAAALALHRSAIVIDTHNDVTQRLVIQGVDLSQRLPDGQTDLPRMREGGLDAEFLSVFVPPKLYPKEQAYHQARAEFDAIDALVAHNPATTVLARTAAEVRQAAADGKIAFLIGVEGGHSLGDASDAELLARLREFYARGARYMTLTWTNSNRIGGSSGDEGKTTGLTPFGKAVVARMNELGILVDVSHVSDATFYDVIATTQRPVIASHSSARALSKHPRNMTDDMLRAVAKNGGVVCVNFGPQFLDANYAAAEDAAQAKSADRFKAILTGASDPKTAQAGLWQLFRELGASLPPVPASLVIDHIDHIARVAGIEHVCLGSDYDGIAAAPQGLDDVSKLPFITRSLLARGYAPDDIRRVLGENVLRVLAANER